VKSECGKGRSAIYEDMRTGMFVHSVKLGARAVGWPADEVRAINAARIAGKSDEQIRALVHDLEAARKARG
jgi:prophage regulatory protein